MLYIVEYTNTNTGIHNANSQLTDLQSLARSCSHLRTSSSGSGGNNPRQKRKLVSSEFETFRTRAEADRFERSLRGKPDVEFIGTIRREYTTTDSLTVVYWEVQFTRYPFAGLLPCAK